MTPIEAKFERLRKTRPKDWIIKPAGRNRCILVYIGKNQSETLQNT